jgi:hypothetical protein
MENMTVFRLRSRLISEKDETYRVRVMRSTVGGVSLDIDQRVGVVNVTEF